MVGNFDGKLLPLSLCSIDMLTVPYTQASFDQDSLDSVDQIIIRCHDDQKRLITVVPIASVRGFESHTLSTRSKSISGINGEVMQIDRLYLIRHSGPGNFKLACNKVTDACVV